MRSSRSAVLLGFTMTLASTPVDAQPRAAEPPAATATIRGQDGAEMVLVPAGEFWMGSDKADEKPRRRVHLGAYHIDRYEVTNELYRRCVQAGACREPQWNEPGSSFHITSGLNDQISAHYRARAAEVTPSNHPVVGVSWSDAAAYCRWAGKRLPTEEEWEKAARGTDGREYPWGSEWDPSRTNWDGKRAPVGSHPSGVSPYGVHDMAGNVWEWVADWYRPFEYKSIRGGPQGRVERTPHSAAREAHSPTSRTAYIGFRCAKGLHE